MIEALVSVLPEIYQPIYGHPELSSQASRPCLDRLDSIARIYDALQRLRDRPLSVLDLGCAQGYFSLNLAERGARVHGVDYLDKNIAVCDALAREHPHLNVSFEVGRVEDVIERLEQGCYDLVLGLSVFHHIVHEKGVSTVKGLLEHVADCCGVLIVELALREEPLYWASAQPASPHILLDNIAFVHEVTRHVTHLAPFPRPLFVASNQYWILSDHAASFDKWSDEPHMLAHGTHAGSRRYFFGANCILKLYRFDHQRGAHNRAEFAREIQFLRSPPAGFAAPALIVHGERENDAWLAMERLPGCLLLDLINERIAINVRAVLLSVLSQLAALEKAGLYHDDVRAWNVLVTEDGFAHLIDYGSISSQVRDCSWPGNPLLSFFIFVREVAAGVVDEPNPLRTISVSPYGLPQPYRTWANDLWQRPLAEWSFGLMYETLLETPAEIEGGALQQPIDAWMKAIEDAIQTQKLVVNHIQNENAADNKQHQQNLVTLVEALEARLVGLQERIISTDQRSSLLQLMADNYEKRLHSAEDDIHVLQARAQEAENRLQSMQSSLIELRERLDATHQNLVAPYSSWSWCIAAPLRWLSGLALHPGATARSSANWLIHSSIHTFQRPLAYLMAVVLRRPQLSYRINQVLIRYPALYQQLLGVAHRAGVVAGVLPMYSVQSPPPPESVAPELINLTPRARQIYTDLKKAIKNNKGAD